MTSERIGLTAIGAAQGVAFWLLIENWPEEHAARALFAALLGTVEWRQLPVFRRSDSGAWETLGRYEFAEGDEKPDAVAIHQAIRQSRIETRPSPYSDLIVDGRRFRLAPQ